MASEPDRAAAQLRDIGERTSFKRQMSWNSYDNFIKEIITLP